MIDWPQRAARLASQLEATGAAGDPQWLDAVRAVPRHELVPSFYQQSSDLGGWECLAADDPQTRHLWAEAVYTDQTLVTALHVATDQFGSFPVPASSSTAPSLMLRMLDHLAVHPGVDVVEIGTGCGYNAALLCARLGAEQVTSIDIDGGLVVAAGHRLSALGWRPDLLTADAAGWRPTRGYDRLIATCGVEVVPPSWLHAARAGAVLLIPLTGPLADGALVRLTATGDGTATGRFQRDYAGFMPLRGLMPLRGTAGVRRPDEPDTSRADRPSVVDPELLEPSSPFAFLAQLLLPRLGPRRTGCSADDTSVTVLTSTDGQWARAWRTRHGEVLVRSGGEPDLWAGVEDVHERWLGHGCPGWERFGLTVTPDAQVVWLDDPATAVSRTRPAAPARQPAPAPSPMRPSPESPPPLSPPPGSPASPRPTP